MKQSFSLTKFPRFPAILASGPGERQVWGCHTSGGLCPVIFRIQMKPSSKA
ncbi:hypothetical protein SLEP1_g44010 [Rubroshorea leprosula]|uniref:Uncharacterized protein n=1 Tax=Rubroshorea leprosula TaxID=152421 RepID=A0AAV5LFH5_9ROSI|nr:hypothetical protein SLEP1_g44010 [Rubroshorea leprosula]